MFLHVSTWGFGGKTMRIGVASALVAVLTVSGCGGGIQVKTVKSTQDQIVVSDAASRLTIDRDVKGHQVRGFISPEHVVCPEPSPDIAKALSESLSAAANVSLSSGDEVGAQVGHSSVESIAQLGERLATVMLLRDEFSDLCRSYANGAVSATTYSVRLSKLDRKMVSLMMGEMAAGAFGRDLAALGGNASYGGGTTGGEEDIEKARTELAAAQKAYQAAVDHEKAVLAKDSANIKEGEREAARYDVVAKQTELVAARQGMNLLYAFKGSGAAVSGPVSVPGGATVAINSEHRVEIARTLERIQQNFISDDQSGTLIDACISALDYAPTLAERAEQLAAVKENSFDVVFAELDAQIADQEEFVERLDKEVAKTSADLRLPESERTASQSDLMDQKRDLALAQQELVRLKSARGSGAAALVGVSGANFSSPLIDTCKKVLADPDKVKQLVSLSTNLRVQRMTAEKEILAQQVAAKDRDVTLKALGLCADYSTDKENAKLPDSLKKMCDAQFKALSGN